MTDLVARLTALVMFSVACLLAPSALPSTPVQVGSLSGSVDLDDNIVVLEDRDRQLTFEQVRTSAFARDFVALNGTSPNFGFSDSAWWVRLELQNRTGEAVTTLLRQDYPLIDDLEFWSQGSNGKWGAIKTGDRRVFSSRDVSHQQFIFRVAMPANSSKTVYLRYASSGSMNIGLTLSDEATLITSIGRAQLGYGIYFGGFLVLLFYNLFIFVAVRDRAFFYYLMYVGSYGLYFGVHNGLTFQYLWPNSPWWGNKSLVVLLSLTLIFAMKFSRSILNSEFTTPRLDRFAAAMQWVSVGGLVGALVLPYSQIILVLAALSALMPPVLIAMGTASLLAGHNAARYFLLAWSTLLVGVAAYMLKTFGLLPHNVITNNGFQIGSLIEMVLLSLALASRVRELQRRSVTDALTGIFNRRFFDDCLTEEFARSARYGQPLSVMLIDVDHFKAYNDTHGHQFGDDALRSVARQLRKTIRKTDRLCRYGGEEFVILMPATAANDARQLAERQREQVSRLRLSRGAVTVSIGVATLTEGSPFSPTDLVEAADKALYSAKDTGRNRVVMHVPGIAAVPATPDKLAAGA